jgi:hypothetical protein
MIAALSPENATLHISYEKACNAVSPYVEVGNRKYGFLFHTENHVHEYESHMSRVRPVHDAGCRLVMLTRFLDSFGFCMLIGVLLPPLALRTWEQHRKLNTKNVTAVT